MKKGLFQATVGLWLAVSFGFVLPGSRSVVEDDGNVWGGVIDIGPDPETPDPGNPDAESEDCVWGEWTSVKSCIVPGGSQIKCFKIFGETLGSACSQTACVDVDGGIQCPHEKFRDAPNGLQRTKTKTGTVIRQKTCKNEDGEIAKCETELVEAINSDQEYKESKPCFSVATCFTTLDVCVFSRQLNKMVCSESGNTTEGSADNVYPHAEFVCADNDTRNALHKECTDKIN